MKIPTKIYLIVGLIVMNFLLQSVNVLNFSFCNFYEYNPNCSSSIAVIVNKNLRFALHCWVIWLCIKDEKHYSLTLQKQFLFYFIASILTLQTFYFLSFFGYFQFHKIALHKILNGLIFSPMIGIGLLAKQFFDHQIKHKT